MKYAIWRTHEKPQGMPDGSVYFSVKHQEYGTLLCFHDKATRAEFIDGMDAVPVTQNNARMLYGATSLSIAREYAMKMWGGGENGNSAI